MTDLLPYRLHTAAVASRLEDLADDVRRRVVLVAQHMATCRWDGAGARAFRRGADADLARLRTASARLTDAAAALRRHGTTVDDLERADAAARVARLRAVVDHVLPDGVRSGP